MGFYFDIYMYRECTIKKNVCLIALRENGVPEFKWVIQLEVFHLCGVHPVALYEYITLYKYTCTRNL
jgi:hypothetical protein